MPNPQAFQSKRYAIEPQWIDYNGHFNMAYYNVLFDRAADDVFADLGLGPDYVKATNNSFFTLETHTTYARELSPTDQVIIETQFLDADHKRVHYVQLMKHADENWLSCVLEVMVSHVDLNLHKTSNFPEAVSSRIQAALADHKALPAPPQVGHKLGIPRKAVQEIETLSPSHTELVETAKRLAQAELGNSTVEFLREDRSNR